MKGVFSEGIIMANKNILIAIESGIIGLDIKKQLNGYGYSSEIINLVSKEKIKKTLDKHFQLMILEKCMNYESIEYAAKLAQEYNLPVIYLSTDKNFRKTEENRQSILMMPFGEDDLRETVKTALGDG